MWLRAVRVLSELDCLFSLSKASSAIGSPACRPVFVEGESAVIDFGELRHPTVCLNPNITSFVDNDVSMGGDSAGIILLTGVLRFPTFSQKFSSNFFVLIGPNMAYVSVWRYLCIVASRCSYRLLVESLLS